MRKKAREEQPALFTEVAPGTYEEMKASEKRGPAADASRISGPESRQLVRESLYLPCKYCGSADCKIAPLKPGKHDESYPFPWTRRDAPQESCRVELTECEKKEYADHLAKLGFTTALEKKEAAKAKEEPKLKPVLNARQIAERFLEALSTATKGRTVEKLCELAGIDPSETCDQVLQFLRKHGKVRNVLGDRWIMA
jgi:hypothetical protein